MTRLTPDRFTSVLLTSLLALGFLTISMASPATAQTPAQSAAYDAALSDALRQRADDVLRLLKREPIEARVFNTNFLNAVPQEQFRAFTQQIIAQHGEPLQIIAFTPISNTSATMKIAFARSVADVSMSLENALPFRIAGLRITGFEAAGETIDAVVSAIDALPGQQGLIVQRLDKRDGLVIAAIDPDGLYAIASSAKLYILAELDRSIQAGERSWSDVLRLGPKSHPSGISQEWPDDGPITLHTLATLMISVSDNSATDTLIRVIGQEKLAAIVRRSGHTNPDALRPFLMTREVSALKTPANAALRAQYLATQRNQRKRLLDRNRNALTLDRIDFAFLTAQPNHIDSIEWFASAADIARLLDYLRRQASDETRAIMAINPGIGEASAQNWRYLGYKGGSETGVMSMNFLLTSRSGKDYAVAGHWNDRNSPVNEGDFVALITRLLSLLAQE